MSANIGTWLKTHKPEVALGAGGIVVTVALYVRSKNSSGSSSSGTTSADESYLDPATTADTTDSDVYNGLESQILGLQQAFLGTQTSSSTTTTPTPAAPAPAISDGYGQTTINGQSYDILGTLIGAGAQAYGGYNVGGDAPVYYDAPGSTNPEQGLSEAVTGAEVLVPSMYGAQIVDADPHRPLMANSTTISPEQVYSQVLADGGDTLQAQVGAALVDGIESSGSPTVLSGGVGPAAGLFQFEPDTWLGDGGGTYAPVAQDASWEDQVQVFVNATKGDYFGDWGPDLGYSGYGESGGPLPGSAVANKIAQLGSSLTGSGGSSSTSSGNTATEEGYNLNPLDLFGIPQTVAGNAASSVWSDVGPFLVKATLVCTGLAIFILAAYKAAAPTLKRGADAAAQLAPLAAA